MVDPAQEDSYEDCLNFYELSQDEDSALNILLNNDVEKTTTGVQNCVCNRCSNLQAGKKVKSKFAGYSMIDPLKASGLTDHQYFLCNHAVMAFIFRIRRWSELFRFSVPVISSANYQHQNRAAGCRRILGAQL